MGIRAEKFAPIHEREDTEFYVGIFEKSYAEKCRARKHRENRERRSPGNARTRKALKSWKRSIPAFGKEISVAEFRAESRAEILMADFELEPDIPALIAEAQKYYAEFEDAMYASEEIEQKQYEYNHRGDPFYDYDPWLREHYEYTQKTRLAHKTVELLLEKAEIAMSEFTDWYYGK